MEPTPSEPEALDERAAWLRRRGMSHYRRHEHAACAALFAELATVAARLDRPGEVADARFWQGAALHGRGALDAAIAVFRDSIESSELTIEDSSLYMTVTRFLRAMVERPYPLLEILDAFHQVETLLAEAKLTARRSRLLLTRARLALARGRAADALALGEQSLEAKRGEHLVFTATSHYWVVTTAALWQGDLPRARRLLRAWEQAAEDDSMSRVLLAAHRSVLARREGDLERALTLGRRAWREAARGEDHQERVLGGHAYARALLLAGRLVPAREILAALSRHLVRMEFGEHAFALRLLHADWHVTRSRLGFGLPLVDPESGRTHRPRRPGREGPDVARRALVRARALYDAARPLGQQLDARLGTAIRRWEIEDRLAACELTPPGRAARAGPHPSPPA